LRDAEIPWMFVHIVHANRRIMSVAICSYFLYRINYRINVVARRHRASNDASTFVGDRHAPANAGCVVAYDITHTGSAKAGRVTASFAQCRQHRIA
jgi:hypothetical protein